MIKLSVSIPAKSYDALAVANGHGDTFALLANAQLVTWQASYSVTPTAINIIIETSLDNTNWNTVATTTALAGETGSFVTSAVFIRSSIASHTGSFDVTVNLVSKIGMLATLDGLVTDGSVLFDNGGLVDGFGNWNGSTLDFNQRAVITSGPSAVLDDPSIVMEAGSGIPGSIGLSIAGGQASDGTDLRVLLLTDSNAAVVDLKDGGEIALKATTLSMNTLPGETTTITTASLVGKTITVTNGIITGFA